MRSRMSRLIAPAVAGAGVWLFVSSLMPSPAGAATLQLPLATDLFPVDDWVGDAFQGVKDVAFGPLQIGGEAIAKLLTTTLGALVQLLIPNVFVDAGIDGIKWICAVPSFRSGSPTFGAYQLNLPHVEQLRGMLTWIGVCMLPVGLVYAGGRAVMAPSAYSDSPQDVVGRVVFAAAWLALYSWGWGSITHFSSLVSDGLLSTPWVHDGIDQLMTGLAIGQQLPVAQFAVLIVELFVALALIGLLMMKIALLLITTFLFVIGGLIGALYPMPFGRKLVGGYCVAVSAVVALPALWALLFTLAAALMTDAGSADGGGGAFGNFIAQMWVLGASFATFAVAIKLGFSAFGFASSTITSFTAGALLGGAGSPSGGTPSPTQHVHKAHSLYQVGSRGGQGIAGGTGRPQATSAGQESVQRTREPAENLRSAAGSSGAAKTAASAGAAAASGGASAAAQGAGAAAARSGGSAAAGSARAGAGQTAPKSGADRRAAASAALSGPSSPGARVRSTGSSADRPGGPTPVSPPSGDSARQTSAPEVPDEPPAKPQQPPRQPPKTKGGKD